MNRKLMNCANLASLAYSSHAIERKCFYSQVSVHCFSGPYPPSVAIQEDIAAGKKRTICLICITEILPIFLGKKLLLLCQYDAGTKAAQLTAPEILTEHFEVIRGRLFDFGIFLDVYFSSFCCLLLSLSPSAGGGNLTQVWDETGQEPPAQCLEFPLHSSRQMGRERPASQCF